MATLLCAGLMTDGDVRVEAEDVSALGSFLRISNNMGISHSFDGKVLSVSVRDKLCGAEIISGLGPHDLDADFEPLLAGVAARAVGSSHIQDAINPNRHAQFLPQFIEAGISVKTLSPTNAIITGPTSFRPFQGCAKEIRGGMVQLLIALACSESVTISGVQQIERGYFEIDEKLRSLGAVIKKI